MKRRNQRGLKNDAHRLSCFSLTSGGSLSNQTDESLNIREDMPGAGKENVEVLLKPNYLILNGEREMKQEKDGVVVTLVYKYNATYYISEEKFNLNQVKAVIKNGVLNVVVPKVRKDHTGD